MNANTSGKDGSVNARLFAGLAAAAVILIAPPVGAQPLSASKASASQAPAPAEKKVCRTVTTLGSILPRHVCATRQQWEEVVRAHDGDGDTLGLAQHPNAGTLCQQTRTC